MTRQDYINSVCVGEPFDKPTYDDDAGTWDLYFEESPNEHHPYFTEAELICVSFDSQAEANEAYAHYTQSTKG
tara:strand:+ start:1903 stop:2121 length:219 start_codon:yes stop_codon:yes gene_type:complete